MYAFNIVVYGKKSWTLLPPSERVYSKMKMKDWTMRPQQQHAAEYHPRSKIECEQEEGDLIFIPNLWAHGVVNHGSTVALALEWTFSLENNPELISQI
eukprot:jgi/Bigna1/61398/fgenesh1_kg.21_\